MLNHAIPFKQRGFRLADLPPRNRIALNANRIGADLLPPNPAAVENQEHQDGLDLRSSKPKLRRESSELGFEQTSGGFRADQECEFPPVFESAFFENAAGVYELDSSNHNRETGIPGANSGLNSDSLAWNATNQRETAASEPALLLELAGRRA